MAKKDRPAGRKIALNRKARRNYFIEETLEAGIVLTGTEVKTLRLGQASIAARLNGRPHILWQGAVDSLELREGGRWTRLPNNRAIGLMSNTIVYHTVYLRRTKSTRA